MLNGNIDFIAAAKISAMITMILRNSVRDTASTDFCARSDLLKIGARDCPAPPPIATADAVAGLSPEVVALAVALAAPPLPPNPKPKEEVPAPPDALL